MAITVSQIRVWNTVISRCRSRDGCSPRDPACSVRAALRQCRNLDHLECDLRILGIHEHLGAAPLWTAINQRPATINTHVDDVAPQDDLQRKWSIQPRDSEYPLL